MTVRTSASHVLYVVRLRAIERELRRDPELLGAFVRATWTTPRRRRKRWDVVLLVAAILGLGLALSPIADGSGHACVPKPRTTATLAHTYERPCD
jgi:hypothetical protein